MRLIPWLLLLQRISKVWCTTRFCFGTYSFWSLYQWPSITRERYICWLWHAGTTLHTSGKDIMQTRSNMQDSLDQVSNWCDNNHMVINPIKTKSMTIATRQKHQLSPLPLDLVLHGAKIEQVSEHRLLGITIENKLRWDSHINNVCKTVSRRVFLLSKLRYIVDTDTRKLFFNVHIKPHIDYASVVWDGCSDVLKRY